MLTSGRQQSCGCLAKELLIARTEKHGFDSNGKRRPELTVYYSAKARCENKNNRAYKYYGARGIEFRFHNFTEFFEEVGPRPTDKHSIDRINNDGNYEVGNLRWATWKQQANNKRKPKRRNRAGASTNTEGEN